MKRAKSGKKRVLIVIVVMGIVVLGILAGYYMAGHFTNKQQTSGQIPQSTQNAQQQPSEESQTQPQDQVTTAGQNQQLVQDSSQTLDTYKAVARFYGDVDAHTIQLSLLNTAFDFKEFEIDGQIPNLNLSPGDIVEVEFEKPQEGANPRIIKIDKPDKVTLRGKFVGLADNNFAEFVFDQKHIVLQISNVADKVSYLDENTDVEVTFKTNPKNPQSNPVVEDIKVLK